MPLPSVFSLRLEIGIKRRSQNAGMIFWKAEKREKEKEDRSDRTTDKAHRENREKAFSTKEEKNPLSRCTRVYKDASNKVDNPTINTSEVLILACRHK